MRCTWMCCCSEHSVYCKLWLLLGRAGMGRQALGGRGWMVCDAQSVGRLGGDRCVLGMPAVELQLSCTLSQCKVVPLALSCMLRAAQHACLGGLLACPVHVQVLAMPGADAFCCCEGLALISRYIDAVCCVADWRCRGRRAGLEWLRACRRPVHTAFIPVG
jgi:hypothetical protein